MKSLCFKEKLDEIQNLDNTEMISPLATRDQIKIQLEHVINGYFFTNLDLNKNLRNGS